MLLEVLYGRKVTIEDVNRYRDRVNSHYEEGALDDMIDPNLKKQMLPESLSIFLNAAYFCLKEQSDQRRPDLYEIVKMLLKAFDVQWKHENLIRVESFAYLKIPLAEITLATNNFHYTYNILSMYGSVYKTDLNHVDKESGLTTQGENEGELPKKSVIIKRLSQFSNYDKTTKEFFAEIEMLTSCKNWEAKIADLGLSIIHYGNEGVSTINTNTLAGTQFYLDPEYARTGYCNEMDEKIIVYEHASKGSLDKYLNDTSFSWTKRLKTCIDIANGLKFLHGGALGQDLVIHRDLKSSIILLNKDWKAKICGFEHALTYPTNQEIDHVIDNVEGSRGYCDPSFHKTYLSSKEADIYSFGVILFEILCGSLACPEDFRDRSQFLDVLVKQHFEEAPLEEMVFEGIKEQIGPKSLATFGKIAFQCLLNDENERPTTDDVVVQLQKALEFQEVYEIREGKLHKKYKEISTITKNDIYNILSKGFLLEDDKLEVMRVLKHRTWNLEQSAQLVRKNDDDDHSE
ncbi:hypothetical protein QVD17_03255 [Tagetes erecta]|uniref:Protein kinase domain-containing protein n=1 Tax=Tagetes erecta TaxID=13708 RepID=A0AAD8P9L4_TARER|nr:hypothetical protein QVD17_03255 [Tagetes erecta]